MTQSPQALVLAFLACLLSTLRPAPAAAPKDALADFVRRPDTSFSWRKLSQRELAGVIASRLEFTSQTWHDMPWTHQLLVVRPGELRNPDIALLLITGDGDVDKQFQALKTLALQSGATAVVVNRVPNQPLFGGRKEDALIAYSFDQYVSTGDPTWPVLFPMVKSAVRAMDAVQEFVRTEFDQKLERFVVSGASKRGWTTWLTAAADPRVRAIAPMVIDMLNMKAQTQWAEKMYGRQSERIHDYSDFNLIARLNEPRMVELCNWVDPYSYRARYQLPKLLLLGTNDPYWVVDSLRLYWQDLPEPKLVFQTPNAGHDLAGGLQARQTLAAFFQMIADRQPLPKMTWEFKPGSTNSVVLDVDISQTPKAVRLWTATSSDRDFRDETWSSRQLNPNPGAHFSSVIETPSTGFRAYLIEAELTSPVGQTYRLSTEARVTPDGPPVAKGEGAR